jgi:hypothetical protein
MTRKQKLDARHITIRTTYFLFTLLALSVVFNTVVPFGSLLLNVPTVKHFNVVLLVVALTAGAILPTLLAYTIGNGSVRRKDRVSHRFNGVLFGLLGFWLAILLPIPVDFLASAMDAVSSNVRILLANGLPVLCVVIVSATLAWTHMHGRSAARDVTEYRPYQAALIGSIALVVMHSAVTMIATRSVDAYALITPMLVIGIGGLSYAMIRGTSLRASVKATWAAVSLTILWCALFVSTQFVTSVSYAVLNNMSYETHMILSALAAGLALVGWVIYWRAQVKSLSKA